MLLKMKKVLTYGKKIELQKIKFHIYEKMINGGLLEKLDHVAVHSKMIDVVHDTNICPEWQNPHGSSTPLKKEDIMRSIGFDEESIEHFAEEELTYKYV